ncbi:1315_t:CDS:2 [Acaulospora colombiana]|uniref:1315_t:CDS:1 n=1 Tax=Acaulospora colombiana TaxID=27376 RepID=A0ACA9KLL2_9GLOM|nr:1315_t:CDS:2 [Acaulospora colombiana]
MAIFIKKRLFLFIGLYLIICYGIGRTYYNRRIYSITKSSEETALFNNASSHDLPTVSIENKVASINKKFCGQVDCKFLYVYFHDEQETKANQHFRSFTQLADALNRTMVLTNVGHSRIEACKPFPFEFYYNIDELRKEFPNVKFVKQSEFLNWVEERSQLDLQITEKKSPLQLSIEHFDIIDSLATEENEISIDRTPDIRLYRKYGGFDNTKGLDLRNLKIIKKIIFKKISIGKRARLSKARQESLKRLSEFMINSFTSESDIILVKHMVRRAIFPTVMPVVPYAEHILAESNMLREKMSSEYIAVHWRMELVAPEALPGCAKGLVKALKKLSNYTGIPNFYLATDYPLLSNLSQSASFRQLTRYHHNAMNILRTNVKINTWASLDGMKRFREKEDYDVEFMSAGVHGILDKLRSFANQMCIGMLVFYSNIDLGKPWQSNEGHKVPQQNLRDSCPLPITLLHIVIRILAIVVSAKNAFPNNEQQTMKN